MSTDFDAEVSDAATALDEVFADVWTLTPMVAAADPNAQPTADPSRPAGTSFAATFFDPETKPDIPRSYDPREARRPSVESASPRIDVSPAALAAYQAANGGALTVQKPDQLTRADGAIFRCLSVDVTDIGYVKIKLNRLS